FAAQARALSTDAVRAAGGEAAVGGIAMTAVGTAATLDRPVGLDTVADEWQLALDDAVEALDFADRAYPPEERGLRRRALARERAETARSLRRLAAVTGAHHVPWISPIPVSRSSLGLGASTAACIFDLDGVLTDSAVLHAAAWGEIFDDLLLRLAQETDRQFVPFDRDADYRAYLDSRPRLEGIHAFLRSRGVRLPEGERDDPADAETAHGLARRKNEALKRIMHRRGVSALPGARRYLEAAGRAGLGRAVVSGSMNVEPMLELAELATLVEVQVGAQQIRAEGLRTRPAPDVLLAACRYLGITPADAVTFP